MNSTVHTNYCAHKLYCIHKLLCTQTLLYTQTLLCKQTTAHTNSTVHTNSTAHTNPTAHTNTTAHTFLHILGDDVYRLFAGDHGVEAHQLVVLQGLHQVGLGQEGFGGHGPWLHGLHCHLGVLVVGSWRHRALRNPQCIYSWCFSYVCWGWVLSNRYNVIYYIIQEKLLSMTEVLNCSIP